MERVDPERELLRRVLPFAPLAALAAFLIGAGIAGWSAGGSAAIGVVVVFTNFVAFAVSFAWAARISPIVLGMVAAGGFIVRLGVIFAVMVALNTQRFFSPLAFGLAVIPATIALLVYEISVSAGRMQADLWSMGERAR